MPSRTTAPTAKRAYNSSRRAQQAAQTRTDVIQAAIELFDENGWAGTTIAAIAARAGVAVETVYKTGGTKSTILRAAMDAAVVGDLEPVALAERPEYAALGEGHERDRIAAAVALVAEIHERSAGVWLALVEAAAADDEVNEWRLELERGRRQEVRRATELIAGREVDEDVVMGLWVLFAPETYLKLVRDIGFTREAYKRFLVTTTMRLTNE